MKVLVLGGSGLVGSHFLRVARLEGHTVLGTYLRFPLADLVPCDCANVGMVGNLLARHQPEAVLYTAGWAWVDGCENEPGRAREENVLQPERISKLCRTLGVHFTFLSSSYVFDGRAGPYCETDPPNPINVYGRCKLEGEERVLAASDGQALVARTTCVYGEEPQGKNFACQVLKAMRYGTILRVPSDQLGNPTYAGDLARWLLALLQHRGTGIFHLAGPHPDCSRPDWARRLVAAFQAAGVKPHPRFAIEELPTSSLGQRALRPLRAGMRSCRLGSKALHATTFEKTIARMIIPNAGDPPIQTGQL